MRNDPASIGCGFATTDGGQNGNRLADLIESRGFRHALHGFNNALFVRHFPPLLHQSRAWFLQVSITLQAGLVEAQEEPRFGWCDAAVLHRLLHVLSHSLR